MSQQFSAFVDKYFDQLFEWSPSYGTSVGLHRYDSQIEDYSQAKATVAVWYVGIVGSGATVQPQQSWRTQTVSLIWEEGGWKVNSFASSAGPTPALATAEADAPGALFTAIPRLREFVYGAR